MQARKRVRRINAADHSSDEFSEDEDDEEEDSEDERLHRTSNLWKRKAERERPSKASDTKTARPSSAANINSTTGSIQEMLKEFFQQQQRMEMQWREASSREADV